MPWHERIFHALAKVGDRLSKTKVTLLIGAALNLAQAFGWTSLTPEQLTSINATFVALAGIFLRDGVG